MSDTPRRPVSRRAALSIGAVGIGAVAVGVAGLTSRAWWQSDRTSDGVLGAAAGGGSGTAVTWAEPAVIESRAGRLDLELTVAEREVAVAGTVARMLAYNDSVPGPTLHVRPGDRLRIRLVNGLDQPTNLHTHGLEVSPAGAGDNPLVDIAPGDSFDYEIDIPQDHPSGVFWYHPHRHGLVADQVFGGLYGAIVLDTDDWADGAPIVAVVSDTTFARGGVAQPAATASMDGRVGETVLTNGLLAPTFAGPSGAAARLLLINACTTRHLDLDLGGRAMRVRGYDGGRFANPLPHERVLVVPGGRVDLEVDIPDSATELVARAFALDLPGMGAAMGGAEPRDARLLTFAPGGPARNVPPPSVGERADLRDAVVARRRTLTMTGGMGAMGGMDGMHGSDGIMGMTFQFDGKDFDPSRVDQEVAIGTVEEWVLRNASPMRHPFHLHTWPMQVMDAPSGVVDVRDVVDVPPHAEVTVRIAFSRHPGTTVYHCHVLDHEDRGMMGVLSAV